MIFRESFGCGSEVFSITDTFFWIHSEPLSQIKIKIITKYTCVRCRLRRLVRSKKRPTQLSTFWSRGSSETSSWNLDVGCRAEVCKTWPLARDTWSTVHLWKYNTNTIQPNSIQYNELQYVEQLSTYQTNLAMLWLIENTRYCSSLKITLELARIYGRSGLYIVFHKNCIFGYSKWF